jgi:hypothetical protein
MYEGTPPDVYVLGIYCKISDLGVDKEINMAAAKNPTYTMRFFTMWRARLNMCSLLSDDVAVFPIPDVFIGEMKGSTPPVTIGEKVVD